MVLGANAKSRRGPTVQVDYLIHIQEIKPWPPTQSLRSLRSVLIQWENDRSSGSTNSVVPSLGSVIGEGKIEFNASFRLPVTLVRELSAKGSDTFQKNCVEFNLHEPRRDKTQLLATAVIDLADYGIVKEAITVSAPMNSKRSFRNTSGPVLYVKIQPVNKGRTSSTSRNNLSREASMEKNGGESVSALTNEEYAEEAEVASFTDDDVSSHSSLMNGGLPPKNGENGPDSLKESKGGALKERITASKQGTEKDISAQENWKGSSSCLSSVDLSSDIGSPLNGHALVSGTPDSRSMSSMKTNVYSSLSPITNGSKEEEAYAGTKSNAHLEQTRREKVINRRSTIGNNTLKHTHEVNSFLEGTESDDEVLEENTSNRQHLEERKQDWEDEPVDTSPQEVMKSEGSPMSDTQSFGGGTENKNDILKVDRLKHVKSVRSPSDSVRTNGLASRNQHIEVMEVAALRDPQKGAGNTTVSERKGAKVYPKDTRSTILDNKVQKLEDKIKMLEGELREAAAIEAALYSIVAEHGSSMSKVHAPARRLSRLYLHASRENVQSRGASAARSAVSGLVLVAKACGNDVPRLTYWLSNAVLLRVIITQAITDRELPLSAGSQIDRNSSGKGNQMALSLLKWKQSSPSRKGTNKAIYGALGDWEDPYTFILALERVEAWIFSRTVESIWWQTLTPHMQPTVTKAIHKSVSSGSKKNFGRTSSACIQDQENISLVIWKEAFKDACERLCPVRAGGHECGCLPVLARLIMEQCVARLDVAMFNAILRESADEIPTDPVSDPISDSMVLPIPAGKSSFGAGALLKNAIGNWSRWLADLFGMDDDDSFKNHNDNDNDENGEREDTPIKAFHLLNALSDLMMLPKDMLLSRSIRKEVCPAFGTPLIKRILDNFVPDEFCPDPIPDIVLEALDSEDVLEAEEDAVTTVPCIAAPPTYLPPAAASIASTISEFGSQPQLRRSGSSMLRKSYTSDDELDELNSPMASILNGSRSSPSPTRPGWKEKEKSNQYAIRYELLKDIWMNSE